MANLFSGRSLVMGESYLSFHTTNTNTRPAQFYDNWNLALLEITYQDIAEVIVGVENSHYIWFVGGSNFKFNEDGAAIGGTLTGLAVYDYYPATSSYAGARFILENFKVPLKSFGSASDTETTDDDDALWSRILAGADTINLSDESDVFSGRAGNDVINGNYGGDYLLGGEGSDTLSGGEGDDWLVGENGIDILAGGLGNDVFAFDARAGKKNNDTITDFEHSVDSLFFNTSVFTSLGGGQLAEDQFVLGKKPLDANDYFLYSNGTLFYDADGSGKGKSLAVVTLTGVPELTHTDIFSGGGWV